jgi:hypothetical protein
VKVDKFENLIYLKGNKLNLKSKFAKVYRFLAGYFWREIS